MEWIALWLGLAVAAGVIADSKGRSGFGYFVLGIFFPLIGVLIALGVPSLKTTPVASDLIACHSCGKPRRADSERCPNCGSRRQDPREGQKRCHACAEWILAEAKKCKHCGEQQPA